MTTPRQQHNPNPNRAADLANVLTLVERAAAKVTEAEDGRDAAIRLAREQGGSLRRIAEHAGIGPARVREICAPR